MLEDLVSEERKAVSWTSSYSWHQMHLAHTIYTLLQLLTVLNSRRKALLSVTGKEAIRAAKERRIASSFGAWPEDPRINPSVIGQHSVSCYAPEITSSTYLTRTRIRSCNILTADLWVWRWESTETVSTTYQIIKFKNSHNLCHFRHL